MVMVRLTKEGEGRDVIWRYLTFVLLQAINGTFGLENISKPSFGKPCTRYSLKTDSFVC